MSAPLGAPAWSQYLTLSLHRTSARAFVLVSDVETTGPLLLAVSSGAPHAFISLCVALAKDGNLGAGPSQAGARRLREAGCIAWSRPNPSAGAACTLYGLFDEGEAQTAWTIAEGRGLRTGAVAGRQAMGLAATRMI